MSIVTRIRLLTAGLGVVATTVFGDFRGARPAHSDAPALTGRTDGDGKLEFGADRDGFWSAEARADGEVARAIVRVGRQDQQTEPLSAYWLFGGLLLLLVIALGYRILRARVRRSESVSRRKPGPTDPLP